MIVVCEREKEETDDWSGYDWQEGALGLSCDEQSKGPPTRPTPESCQVGGQIVVVRDRKKGRRKAVV
jgi:hypothetical protein